MEAKGPPSPRIKYVFIAVATTVLLLTAGCFGYQAYIKRHNKRRTLPADLLPGQCKEFTIQHNSCHPKRKSSSNIRQEPALGTTPCSPFKVSVTVKGSAHAIPPALYLHDSNVHSKDLIGYWGDDYSKGHLFFKQSLQEKRNEHSKASCFNHLSSMPCLRAIAEREGRRISQAKGPE